MKRRISIVIPVYNARAFAERCIATVRQHARGDWRLILVNDRSTDEELNAGLRRLRAEDSRILLFENAVNRGFVATANVGMRAAGTDDVLLLNSDTEVFEGFLERLAAATYADDCTGIVSPFSNNATLCSIPVPFQDNPIPEGWTPEGLNRLIASSSLRERPEVPTSVGFCMFIRNEVFADAGFFDEATYGRGFGEENDFCELAKEAGWKIRLADDVFVYHKGKASFGDEGRDLERRNLAILEGRHPGYLRGIANFIAQNPLRPLHERVRLQLRRQGADSSASMLFVLHASPWAETPGGTEFHVHDLVRKLRFRRAVILFPKGQQLIAAEVIDGVAEAPLLYRFPLRRRPRRFMLEDAEVERLLRRLIRAFGVTAAHVHHLMYWPISAGRVLSDAGIPYAFTAHDYFAVCPNWNLFDAGSAAPCSCDAAPSCEQSCLPLFFKNEGSLNMPPGTRLVDARDRHRAAFAEVLGGATLRLFPSQTARDEVLAFHRLDPRGCTVIEHGYEAPDGRGAVERRAPGGPLRLLVIGEVAAPVKGAANYRALIQLTRDLPLAWHFIGRTPQEQFRHELEKEGLMARVTFHGRVHRSRLFERISEIGPDLGVLLPAWHETFSYVLSEMLLAGVPVLVNDLGAPGERTRRSGTGWVVSSVQQAAEKLREVAGNPSLLRAVAERVRECHHVSLDENATAHREAYDRAGLLSRLDQRIDPQPLDVAALAACWSEAAPRTSADALAATHAAVADPGYQRSKWYRPFLKIKPLIPGALRRAGRDILLRYQYKTWRVLHANRHGKASGLRMLKRRFSEATWEVHGLDPQIVFNMDPVATRTVRLIRFRLLRDVESEAFAQLYWTHLPGEPFDETRSVRVSIDGRAGEWREYVIRLDGPEVAQAWSAGERIHKLRFDPINVPGVISLGPIELGG